MLMTVVFAALIVSSAPVDEQPDRDVPAGRPSSTPAAAPASSRRQTTFELHMGWSAVRRVDPYGRFGATPFTLNMPQVGALLRSESWYAELAGQMMSTSLANRNITASVGRELFRIGAVRGHVSAEFAEVRFRREDFRTNDTLIGTNRTAMTGLTGIGIGLGRYRGTSGRLTVLGGWYRNRYGSIAEFPGFRGEEPMADDDVAIIGARFEVAGVPVGGRLEVGGGVRYLRLSGHHAPSIPNHELSGTASLSVRLFTIRKKQLFVGGFARFGPSGPSLIADKTFGLRGIWRLK